MTKEQRTGRLASHKMIKCKDSPLEESAERAFAARLEHLDVLLIERRRSIPVASIAGVDRLPEPDRNSLPQVELDIDVARRQKIETPDGPIWVEGHLILCECPDCRAPMSMRISLAMANCWRCESCIELTPAQLRAIQQYAERETGRPAERFLPGTAALASPSTQSTRPPSQRRLQPPRGLDPHAWAIGPRRPRRTIRDHFNALPAWLVSMLLHLALLLILALILLPQDSWNEAITITTFLDPSDTPGGDVRPIQIEDMVQDDLLPEPLLDMGERELRQFKVRAEQDAQKLLVDDTPLAPLPDLESVKQSITTHSGTTRLLAARDPRVRADIVRREGGSTLTEASVSRGLRWLASVQNEDGSWSLQRFDRSKRANNRGDAAATALALLPFLGAGQTHEFGVYKSTVAKGLNWLLEHQKSDGDMRAESEDESNMYAHGQATIDLIEAYAMTGDAKFRGPAQRAIDFIEKAQHRAGGWRYNPGQEGDTSVLGWQLMALQSARMSGSGLDVNESTLKLADYYLDLVSPAVDRDQTDVDAKYRRDGVLYRYQANREPTQSMTAEAILCRMYLGWQKDDPRLMLAVDWLNKYHAPDVDDDFNLYYWYYATQVMHNVGGAAWKEWNSKLRDLLVLTQETRGRYAGSWDPSQDEWSSRGGGRIFATAMAVCILEVYYRHLPLFKQLEL